MVTRANMTRGKGWKGIVSGDIRIHSIGPLGRPTKSRHVLKPGASAHAMVKEHPLGHRGMIPQISARSILARLGVQVHFSQEQIRELVSGDLPRQVTLSHSGHIPIQIRRGNRTHRVYYPNHSLSVGKKEARILLKRGDLVLGNDFKWLPSGMLELTPHAVVYEIPRSDIATLSKINWATGSKRKVLMQYLQRKKKPLRTDLGRIVLTECKYVKLPNGGNAPLRVYGWDFTAHPFLLH
ncbi:MAG: hypothetical protein V1776_03885 [Candidatus Diapherotrites archaeon]